MVYRFCKTRLLIVFLGFFLITLLGGAYGLSVAGFNLWYALLLLWVLNPFLIQEKYIMYGGCLVGVLLVSCFCPLSKWGVWLFLFGAVLGAFFNNSVKGYGVAIVLIAGFFNLSFVTNTNYGDIQHDWASCFNYVQYILENNFMFWKENPFLMRPSYSTYHPVLHFLLVALFYLGGNFVVENLGQHIVAHDVSLEAIQVLTCFYVFIFYIFANKTLQLFDFKPMIYLSCLVFLCSFGIYNTISGFINNDSLLLCLQSGAIYYAFLYYKEGSRRSLWLIVFFCFFAVLTKLSGVLVLPLVFSIFVVKLWKKRSFLYAKELGVACFFLCLGVIIWPVYQYVFLAVSYDYVPDVNEYPLAKYSYIERFSLLPMFFYKDIFYFNGQDYFGFNLWEVMCKTALFGEYNFSWRWGNLLWLMHSMVWMFRIIVVLFFMSVFYVLFKETKDINGIFLLILFVGIISGEVFFVMKHPYMCNQDFRYIAIVCLPFIGILGKYINQSNLLLQYVFSLLLWVFAISSVFLWWQISI